jgi:hypothetical protein
MKVMGIDPSWGKPIAWAIADEQQKILDFGLWKIPKSGSFESFDFHSCDHLYLEGIYPNSKNMNSARKLELINGRIMECASRVGIELNFPENFPIQNEWMKGYNVSKRFNTKTRKHIFRNIVNNLYLIETHVDDEDAAILIALYGARRVKTLEMMRGT